MRYLSWDIGIINLSYCLLEYKDDKIEILDWENINISLDRNNNIKKCCGIMKNQKLCNKNSTYFDLEYNFYCKKHKNENSYEIKSKKCIFNDCKKNKKYFTNDNLIGYCEKHKKEYNGTKTLKKKLTNKEKRSDLEMISEVLIKELDKREHLLDCDIVVIENQPAIKNPKMKSIQMIIYTYFLIRGKIDKNKISQISFLLASNKLKINILNKELLKIEITNKFKNKYKQNKELSKLYCFNILNNFNILNKEKWIEYYNKNKKKDDLADTFLMIIYMIQK